MNEIVIVLVALCRYQNFAVRIIHPLLEKIDGVRPYTIFFKNSETNLFAAPTALEEELFIKCVTELNPRLVGFSVLSPFLPIARKLTGLVKDNSSSLVIWGGVHPTIFPESCINDADMLCIGEGEGAITELAISLRDKKPYSHIKNIWSMGANGIIKNPLRPLMQDLDSLPFPSYGNGSYYFIENNKITKRDPALTDNIFYIQTSRGCHYSCSYCAHSLLHPMFKNLGPYVRRRSADNVLEEIKRKERPSYVLFVDEVFAHDGSWLDGFSSKYKKEIGLPFFAAYYPKAINQAILGKLIDAGIETIGLGIQTGTDHVRNRIFNRPGRNDEIVKTAREIADNGIKIKYDMILDNPYDTAETLKETIGFLLRLPKPLFFNLFSLQYFPLYPLTEKAIKEGRITREEASFENLIEKTARGWAFIPRFPRSEKDVLQNVIWLIAGNRAKDNIVKYSVFGDSLGSKLCLMYLNFKSIVLGKILGVGGALRQYRWIRYIIKGVKCILTWNGKILLKRHS